MVDFNDANTTGKSAYEIMRMIVIERRYNCFEAFEKYKNITEQGQNNELEFALVKARLYTYWLEVRCIAERRLKKELVLEIEKKVNSNNFQDLEFVRQELDHLLDNNNLIRIDNFKFYERVNVEEDEEDNYYE